ncbi:hypothetical protein LguiA_031754 [Lonicera macranthoides]
MAGCISLDAEQLRQLAMVIHYQEVDSIHNIKFESELELAKYLADSRAGYDSVLRLLDESRELDHKFGIDQTRGPIACDIISYIQKAIDVSLQFVKNYRLRVHYLKKVRAHAMALINELQEVDPKNVTNIVRLAKDAVLYRNVMLEYRRKHQNPVSRNFSKWIKEKGLKFQELVERRFQDLEDVQKLQVYEEIMEASGRGRVFANGLTKALKVAGIAMFLFNAGMIVWDIYSSEQKLQTATRHAIVALASVGGAMLGDIVGVALSSALLAAGVSTFFVVTVGILTGILGAFILGEFVGWLIDLIFSSAGNTSFSTDLHRCYVAVMPDGETLARQIAHQNKSTK